jgi:hypothetical protein
MMISKIFKILFILNVMINNIYFISGHLDVTCDEFNEHYVQAINNALENPLLRFVIGDAKGADTLSQEYLLNKCKSDDTLFSRITIYHIGDKPRNYLCNKFLTINGFKNDDERDTSMTNASNIDIAWIRPMTLEHIEKIKSELAKIGRKYNPNRISGTEKNIIRRQKNVITKIID